MGKTQSKRSVDITTDPTKDGVVTEGTGKLEKIEDVDQLKTQANGDAQHNEGDTTPATEDAAAATAAAAPATTEAEVAAPVKPVEEPIVEAAAASPAQETTPVTAEVTPATETAPPPATAEVAAAPELQAAVENGKPEPEQKVEEVVAVAEPVQEVVPAVVEKMAAVVEPPVAVVEQNGTVENGTTTTAAAAENGDDTPMTIAEQHVENGGGQNGVHETSNTESVNGDTEHKKEEKIPEKAAQLQQSAPAAEVTAE